MTAEDRTHALEHVAGRHRLLDLAYVVGALVFFWRMLAKVRANGGLSRFGE